MRRLTRFLRLCAHLGTVGTARLFKATVLDPVLTPVERLALSVYRPVDSMRRVLGRRTGMRRWRKVAADVVALGRARHRIDLRRRERVVLVSEPAVGFAPSGNAGRVKTGRDVSLQVVEGIRKSYLGRSDAFLNDLNALHKLGLQDVSVPAILDIDFDEPALVTSFAGDEHVTPGIAMETVKILGDELHRIHRAGVVLGGFNTEMVVVDREGKPWWVDFTSATDYSRLPRGLFRFLADVDIASFNGVFGTSYPTYQELRNRARSRSLSQHFGSYSPAYLGAGIRTGPIWGLGTGWGRWESLLRRSIPDPAGMRVLDLGSNNGQNGLEMLRAGAEEVIGIELNPERVAQGDRLKQAYEWFDGCPYGYTGYQADMRDVMRMGLGSFDMVTALCSLYYLAEDEMANLVSELREVTPVLVLECNQRREIGRSDPDTYRRASLDFNLALLRDGGFADVEVIAPKWSERPLLVARR